MLSAAKGAGQVSHCTELCSLACFQDFFDAASSTSAGFDRVANQPQPHPPLPTVLGKQLEHPVQAQPAAKRAKKEKGDIEDENDILKVVSEISPKRQPSFADAITRLYSLILISSAYRLWKLLYNLAALLICCFVDA